MCNPEMKQPKCPWCGSRMLPQVTEDKMVVCRCANASCMAVSPRADTFNHAAEKALNRAEKPLEWHDRETDPPTVFGPYLCEYTFDPPGNLRVRQYGVLYWQYDDRFQHEKTGHVFHGQELTVLRWMDFKEGLK